MSNQIAQRHERRGGTEDAGHAAVTRRRRLLILGGLAALTAVLLISFAARVPFTANVLRDRLVATLSDRLDADVELDRLELSVLPRLRANGTALSVRREGSGDVPPLIAIDAFAVDASVLHVWRRHVDHVRLDGLVISIPPSNDEPDDVPGRPAAGPHVAQGRQVVVDDLEAPGTRLVIIPRAPTRPPKVWLLHELRVRSVSANTAMPFDATLTNAVPPGLIRTGGSFGPWHRDDPGHTPLDGRFTFEHADLGVFKGISGLLSAHGTYGGTLETIEVHGETETPDFAVNVSGQTVPLHTTYHAVVDGTNGDTRLESIDASFLRTSLNAHGEVAHVEGAKGREVSLDVKIDEGRLEDVLRLAVKSPTAPMTGALSLVTRLVIPPGDRDVVDKLRLEGRFAIDGGMFADREVQRQIATLSQRARGRQGTAPAAVPSDFRGRFALADAVLTLPELVFDVPGAVVELSGTYGLRTEALAFEGELVMDAKISETVNGWKSWLLKPLDPLFRREGRTAVPIKIGGTRASPRFGLDVKRVFRGGP